MKTLVSLLRPFTLGMLALALALALAVSGCSGERLDNSEGSVILSITDFDGLPRGASVNGLGGGPLTIEELTLSAFPKNPREVTGTPQSIEIDFYEIVYTRADRGTRVPPPRVRSIFGLVPIGGTLVYEGLDILGAEQLLNPPLDDLLFENGGFDRETGSPLIVLNARIRFFGRTLNGDQVVSGSIDGADNFTLELTP